MFIIWILGLVLLFLLIVFRSYFYLVEIIGTSMEPSLKHGTKVLIFRAYPAKMLRQQQIIVFNVDQVLGQKTHNYLIKRVVGLAGSSFSISETLEILGPKDNLIEEFDGTKHSKTWEVRNGYFFVKSDNLGVDSYTLGPIPFDCLVGVVVFQL